MTIDFIILIIVFMIFLEMIGPILVQDLKEQIYKFKQIYKYYKELI
jgi:hypothetical protein